MKTQIQIAKDFLKTYAGKTLFRSGVHGVYLRGCAVVLALHSVSRVSVDDRLTCELGMFERLCRFVSDYFHVVELSDLVQKMRAGDPLDRLLAITFDDGYRDNHEHAAPFLKSMGLPATFFVTTRFIGSPIVPRWHRKLGIARPWMTWEQVGDLAKEGFEIGAHSQTHADLGTLSQADAFEEIYGSRNELEGRLSTPIRLFAYPFGGEANITRESRAMVEAAGFIGACSCHGGVNDSATDPFQLRRIPVASWHRSPEHLGCDILLRRA